MFHRKLLWTVLLFAGILGLPVCSPSQQAASAPSQATPASGGTAGAQAQAQTPSVQPEIQLSVECVVDDKHECTTDASVTLGHHIKLRVHNLKSWIDKKNSPSNLVLFMNGRQLAKTNPVAVSGSNDPAHPELNELLFKLQRTAETDATWDDLIVREKNWRGLFLEGVSRKLRPSVGVESGLPAESAATFELVLLPPG